jgi:hypothetical protein
MNIIRTENVKSVSATTYSLTVYVEKCKDLNKPQHLTVILSDDDLTNINSLVKLKGYIIDTLVIPKKYRFTFNDTEHYKILQGQLRENNYTITYF